MIEKELLTMKFKKMLIFIIMTLLFTSCESGFEDMMDEANANNNNVVYNLRDRGPAGGWIFYINPNYEADGWRYLEAAPEDISGTRAWKIAGSDTPGTLTAIGAGYANTTHMTGVEHPAAEVVRNATYGEYNDWFLPSKDELIEMCWVLHSRRWNGSSAEDNPEYGANRVGNFADLAVDVYWSSSEFNTWDAVGQHFFDGRSLQYPKTNSRRVRAVRRF